MKKISKTKRGFAAMTPEQRREIAVRGGKSIPAAKRAFSANRELAAEAGRLGGKMVKAESRSLSANRELAVSAGRKGGLLSHEGNSTRTRRGMINLSRTEN